jgi:hypothetical protein
LLCTYAIVALQHEAKDPLKAFSKIYCVRTLRRTYQCFLLPFSIQDLESTSGCEPPEYKKQPGRPKTKRIRKGAFKRKETKCGTCGGTKHNACTCRNAPKHTRRQRLQDRNDSSSSNTDTDIELDQDSDQDSDLDSLNSELLQEMQFQAEMD